MHKSLLTISSILLLGASSYAVRADNLAPQENIDFKTYVLALSWQPGFCQSKDYAPKECSTLRNGEGDLDALTIHGLWPSLPDSLQSEVRGVSNWHSKGCSAVTDSATQDKYPIATKPWCDTQPVAMSPAFHQKLVKYMPGINEPTCLHQYEYAKHGVCFGFPPEDYFGAMVRLNSDLRNSPVGKFMKDNYGKVVKTADFKQVIAETYGVDASNYAVQLSCSNQGKKKKNNQQSFLTEMRLTLKEDAINFPLADTSFDTTQSNGGGNCGKSFKLIKYKMDE